MIVAETSMAFSMEDYRTKAERESGVGRGMAIKPDMVHRVSFPLTPVGQMDYMVSIMRIIAEVPNKMGRGFIYWEPAWLPAPGTSWSTKAGCEYIQEEGYGCNEWANQALFDYQGLALPALAAIRDFAEDADKT